MDLIRYMKSPIFNDSIISYFVNENYCCICSILRVFFNLIYTMTAVKDCNM